jgi:hypothetical protein
MSRALVRMNRNETRNAANNRSTLVRIAPEPLRLKLISIALIFPWVRPPR